jgi:hypothetical protein
MMSFFRIAKGVLEKLDYHRSRFFWQCDEHKKKYRLAKWSILHKPRSAGGMGIIDLDIQNKCLLSKWVFKLLNEDGIWQHMLRKKYLKCKTLSHVERRKGDSHFWSGLMEIKKLVLERGRFQVHDGSQTRFWEDLWLGRELLSVKYPALYNIVKKKNMSVAHVLSMTPLNAYFRRALVGVNWDNWLGLVGNVLEVNLSKLRDSFRWTASKKFSVKDLYNDLVLRSGTPADCWA